MNRLANSLSPYLLQHQHNPVDWYPWGEEAFEEARRSERIVFLSVGYAACHWCHVMERESFENEAIAAFLNRHFVSIKVDREERPDIDQVYMNAVQVMTGHGGWPMSVFLTADRRPFYAGTYWPPTPRGGMPSFPQVLEALVDAWDKRRSDIESHAGEITAALEQLARGGEAAAESIPGDDVVTAAADRLVSALDRRYGGFGSAPKFPHATDLDLLLRLGSATGNEETTHAAEFTLDRMAAGGIRDHIGGGFARYSVDDRWLVPHFEKMLYDNALLGEVYLRAYQVTGHRRHADVARETLDYICRDLRDPCGGFHCSEDADSEGVEGKFYVWTPAEVTEVLGAGRGERFCQIYDITDRGNFEGKSIPNLPEPITAWAEKQGISQSALRVELADDRERLRLARESRVRPGRDDKLLTSWNALAIRALATGAMVLDEPRYLEAAVGAATFIEQTMRADDGSVLHAYRDGTAHIGGFIDDYAYVVDAWVTLFEATGQARWLRRGCEIADAMIDRFYDGDVGGFFYTPGDGEPLITRNKDWHDGSLVSGNAAAAMGLLKLSRLCDRADFRDAAESTLRAGEEVLRRQAAACGGLLSALDRALHDREQLVCAVADAEQFGHIRPQLFRDYRPRTTISWVVGEAPESGPAVALNADKPAIDGRPTLYRCQDFTCEKPISGESLAEALGR